MKLRETKLAQDVKVNPKAFYSYIANRTKPKETVASLRKENGDLTENDKEKAEEPHKFFASVFTQEPEGSTPAFECGNQQEVTWATVTEDQMSRALKNLNHAKSQGPDKIHPRILKELADEFAKPLTILFQKTIKDGKEPDKWKEAKVRPIFKKGDKSSSSNYRPVSLTSIICKIFEGFIRDVIYNHITQNHILSIDQYGFTEGRSCTTQLLVTLNEWLTDLDNGFPVDTIYLDLRKTFDTVPPRRLLTKLEGYGVKGNLLNWIKDFLSDRTQYVSVNGNCSKSKLLAGFPQGSVLGPTLFIYYINDMPNEVKSHMKFFC